MCHARAQAEGAKVADAEGELYDCTWVDWDLHVPTKELTVDFKNEKQKQQ